MKKFITITIAVLFLNTSATYNMSYSNKEKELEESEIKEAETRIVRIKNEVQKFFESKGIRPSDNLAEIIGNYTISIRQIIKANNQLIRTCNDDPYNLDEIKKCLENGANVNHRDTKFIGYTPLRAIKTFAYLFHQKRDEAIYILTRAGAKNINEEGFLVEPSLAEQDRERLKERLTRRQARGRETCLIS